jgi:hypothetical protein
MTQPQPSIRSKRARATKAATAKPRARPAKTPVEAAAAPVSAEQRRAMIAEAAYLRAAERGFNGGDPVADWLESERAVDALLTLG